MATRIDRWQSRSLAYYAPSWSRWRSCQFLAWNEREDEEERHRFNGGDGVKTARELARRRLHHAEEPRRAEAREIRDRVDQCDAARRGRSRKQQVRQLPEDRDR